MTELASLRLGLPLRAGDLELAGRGVIVGIVDYGVDCLHPSIEQSVLAVLDDDANVVWQRDRELLPLDSLPASLISDAKGHGTHIAASLVGRGAVRGVAPEASLVVAKAGTDDRIVAAVEAIFELADQLQMPAVVNLSLGGQHSDGHDGADGVSRRLDELAGAGRVVCAAAGNEGADWLKLHVAGTALPGQLVEVPFVLTDSDNIPRGVPFDRDSCRVVGYTSSSAPMSVILETNRPELSGGVRLPPGADMHLALEGMHLVMASTVDPLNGDFSFAIEWISEWDGFKWESWSISLLSHADDPVDFHLWSRDATGTFATATGVSRHQMVCSPASARSVIAVGAVQDRALDGPGAPIRLWELSNWGPTRDGRVKPDLVAPGYEIVSVRSRQLEPPSDLSVMSATGTSFAAPIVTGIVACMLEARPTLDSIEVRELLSWAAEMPVDAFREPDGWGAGEPSAARLSAFLGQAGPGEAGDPQ
ncbi:MAG: hypothetical protein B7C54_11795 [Acidimicrobiales bacterium mtb01]|nr:hypothetical protein [Actinomycetota bacterium]TEX45729.1 MAG: hypothetical protein B7C54_11795 [Acidimicrobiales bacterium mtb01]